MKTIHKFATALLLGAASVSAFAAGAAEVSCPSASVLQQSAGMLDTTQMHGSYRAVYSENALSFQNRQWFIGVAGISGALAERDAIELGKTAMRVAKGPNHRTEVKRDPDHWIVCEYSATVKGESLPVFAAVNLSNGTNDGYKARQMMSTRF